MLRTSFALTVALFGLLLAPGPAAAQPVGACCSNTTGQCVITTQEICEAGGRDYQGDGTTCEPNPCDETTGACCFPDETCQNLTLVQCQTMGGVLDAGGDCATTTCPELGACCLVGNLCTIAEPQNCLDGDGIYFGQGTTCFPDPCNPATGVNAEWSSLIFSVSHPFPNPTRAAVSFQVSLPQRADVDLRVVDVAGRQVTTHRHSGLDAGAHTLVWFPADDAGRRLPDGIYFLRVETRFGLETRKLVVAR